MKKNNLLYFLVLYNKIYTWFWKYFLGECGANSYLESPAKIFNPSLINVGKNVHICEHAWLNAKDDRGDAKPTMIIGDGTYIGRFVHINAWQQVVIEENVLISDRVYISDANHKYEDIQVPIRLQGDYFKGLVRLKKGCWIGIGAVILPGVTVGENSVVSANSVVKDDVPDYSIVAGNPAKIVKHLKTDK